MRTSGFVLPSSISFGELLLSLLIIFFMVAFFAIAIQVLLDVFRSTDLSGWAKAGWALLVVVLPFVGLFAYLIVRGGGMGARRQRDVVKSQQDLDARYERAERAARAAEPGEDGDEAQG